MARTHAVIDGGLMLPAEVAATFGVSTRTLARWAKEGMVRTMRTRAGRRHFNASDVRACVFADIANRASTDLPHGVLTPQRNP